MKPFTLTAAFVFLLVACDQPLIRPKGSDTEWQQQQEQLEQREEQLELDESEELEEDQREANLH
jgi:hypothetical protein